jgi:hypothetical protein
MTEHNSILTVEKKMLSNSEKLQEHEHESNRVRMKAMLKRFKETDSSDREEADAAQRNIVYTC